jgi:protein-S-isoprenylcysteine O-methyltransferase Ste14
MTVFADIPPGLMRKFVVRTTLWIIFLGIVLFGTAGTIHWPQGWIYLGFLTVVSFVSGPWLAKHDPELFRERLGSLFQKEQKVGTALLFGSWWGLLAVALFGLLIAVRAVLEEETLKAKLEGYADYAAHVRYRLVPLLW